MFGGVHVAQSLVFCVKFSEYRLSFVLFPLGIVLSVLLIVASEYHFGICKLFIALACSKITSIVQAVGFVIQ